MKSALLERLPPSDFKDVALYTRRSLLARGMAIGLGAATLAACDLFGRHFHWFQKLTVTVATPDGFKTGIEVIESKVVFYSEEHSLGGGGRFDISGEAGVIEVSPGKYLFMLLRNFNSDVAEVMFVPKSPPLEPSAIAKAKRYAILETFGTTTRTAELLPSLYPIFVTFRDIADPATLVIVDPQNLEEHFGAGVTLHSVYLTVSPQETIPNKVRDVLPWLAAVRMERGRIIPSDKKYPVDRTIAEKIDTSDFLTPDRWKIG